MSRDCTRAIYNRPPARYRSAHGCTGSAFLSLSLLDVVGGFPSVAPPYCNVMIFFSTLTAYSARPLHLRTRIGWGGGGVLLVWQAVDMVGAGRRVPQGLRFDIINTLERYQMGEYAIARYQNSFVGFVCVSVRVLYFVRCRCWFGFGFWLWAVVVVVCWGGVGVLLLVWCWVLLLFESDLSA